MQIEQYENCLHFRAVWSIIRSSSSSRQHQATNSNASSKQPDRQGTQQPPISVCSNTTHHQSSPREISPVPYWPWWVINLISGRLNHYFIIFPGDDRILIFASPEQLHVLQTAQDFLVDGTFKVVPDIFYQLFVIRAIYRQHTIPVVYALLRRKDAGTYSRLFDEIVKIAPTWLPASVMMDFEQVLISSLKKKFRSVSLSDCYFHLRQSIHRKLQVRKILQSKHNWLTIFLVLESWASNPMSNKPNVRAQHPQNCSIGLLWSELCREQFRLALWTIRRAIWQYSGLFWRNLYRYVAN